jgi:hypothetical protein
LDITVLLNHIGFPKTKDARVKVAEHFHAQATKLKAKAAGLEDVALLLEMGVVLPMEPPPGQYLDWPDRDATTIPARRITCVIHGIDTPDQPLPGIETHALVEGNLKAYIDEDGVSLTWREPWQMEPMGFHLRPVDEQDGKRMAAVFTRIAKALMTAGKSEEYRAQVPSGRICNLCLDQPVRPKMGTLLKEIKQHRDTHTCTLCLPVVERALAMGLRSVQVWNGRVIKLNPIPSKEAMEQALDSL